MPSVFLDSSNQKDNIGVGNYGDEATRMNFSMDMVKYYIEKGNGGITVYRNNINMSLYETVKMANDLNVNIYVAGHSNAGGGKGTEGYFYPGSADGERLATCLYNRIAPITISPDRGVKSEDFYVLRNTNMTASLIEVMFHDNLVDVTDYLNKIDLIAKAYALGIYDYFGIPYQEPTQNSNTFYRVMCGSFRNKDYAEKRKKELESLGYGCTIMKFEQ